METRLLLRGIFTTFYIVKSISSFVLVPSVLLFLLREVIILDDGKVEKCNVHNVPVRFLDSHFLVTDSRDLSEP